MTFSAFDLFGVCLGDEMLTALGIPAWSNGADGVHYTIYYAFLFLIPAYILALRFVNDRLARISKGVSAAFMSLLAMVFVFTAV